MWFKGGGDDVDVGGDLEMAIDTPNDNVKDLG
jgi:hypothetical protein